MTETTERLPEALPKILCRLDDIPDREGKGFALAGAKGPIDIFVVRRGDAVFGYHNVCPHVGTPLDWVDDRFMTLDKSHILCATHAAEFRIEDGLCVAGPCVDDSLTPIELEVRDGNVVLTDLAPE